MGVAVLRDLALNGGSAVLPDRGDFCAGASSASTPMAHGGLRYPEGREFRLVAEAARERNLMLRHAAHLVRPLEIVVPLNGILRGLFGAALRFVGLSQKSGEMCLVALKAHLVLHHPALHAPMAGWAFYFDDGRGRRVICLPLAETILKGATEVETASTENGAVAEAQVSYSLAAISGLFGDIRMSKAHLVSVTTGIRPLQNAGGSANHAARDHALHEHRLPQGGLIGLRMASVTLHHPPRWPGGPRPRGVLACHRRRHFGTVGRGYQPHGQDRGGWLHGLWQ